MDSAENLIAELERRGITVWAEADRLRYKAPQGALTPELRQRLTDEKGRLLALLARADGAWRGAGLPPIKRRADAQPSRLSYSQQRLWVLAQMLPDSPVYNMPFAYHLRGMLDVDALGQALGEIVRRHSSLRTVFVNSGGQPLQAVSAPGAWTLPVVDLSGRSGAHRPLEQLLQEAACRSFDLAQGPLFHAQLYRLGIDDHVLQLTLHHIISDGWSTQLLLREMESLYEAFSCGRPSPLAELPIEYADFAAWQREWLQDEVLEGQLDYWKKQLKGAPALLELPTERPRPATQTHRGATETALFPQSLLAQLNALSRAEGASLFMTLLAAFQALLGRYSGQDDIVVGSPIAGRNRPEVEGLIGFFVNMLVLRGDLSGNPTFRELLGRVRDVALAAYAHQDLPFERLVEELQPERNLSYNPLFQVSFALEKSESAKLGALKTSWESVPSGTSKFDLSVEMMEGPEGLLAAVEYSTDLFGREMIQRLLAHWRVLLEGIVADPGRRIMGLPLLTGAEFRQLQVEWNETDTDYPAGASIQELFEAQVRRTPEAVALEHEGERVTYGELNARANQLAHYLGSQGVGPEVMVGICAERSVEMVVGILGIVKAGGAYVPLDPEYPASRLSFMLQDAAVPVLLTQSKLRGRLPAHAGRTVCLDADWPRIAGESQHDPKVRASARNLAYVIYTSGSTGRPKGACIEQRSVVRLVKNTNYIELGPQEVLLQFAPISFDASTLELWGSLLNGARLVIAPAGLLSLQELGRVIQERGVTTLWLTAALFHKMVDEHIESLRSVRQLLAGGETLSPSHVSRMLEVIGSNRLINGYGPTENTTFTCCHVMTARSRIDQTVPIGRPISNTRVYVLDGQLQPVPVGVCGELYVGGDGLAREYLNQKQLTAEKFVPDPFSTEPGARLYRTGDMVRYRKDGCIEFLGRFDHQVKIRGYRIELGEIEAALQLHPALREVVVLAREDAPGDKRLVAYVVAEKPPEDLVDQLRTQLRATLPEYMLPAHFVTLDSLPLTPVGKVDRKALPAPDLSIGLESAFVAPRTPTEELLAGIWIEVLGVDRVGTDDNFFDLGGHSLLAMQVVSRVRQALAVELPLRDLFAAPTVARLSLRIQALSADSGSARKAPPLDAGSKPDLAEASFSQQRLWVLDQIDAESAAYIMAGALELRGALDTPLLERSLATLVSRHESLRTVFQSVDGRPMQVVSEPGPWTLPLTDLSGESDAHERLKRLLREEARRSFDLTRGPLFRAQLYRVAADAHFLLLTMHHIISDGWSVGILTRELGELYGRASRGEPARLPALPIQYRDFASWQRAWLQGEALEVQLSHWRARLAGAPQVLELPTDRPRPAVGSQRGANYSFTLPLDVANGLRGLARREGVTLYMVLLSGFALLLSRYSGQQDLLIGTPVANRNRVEIEDVVGCFVNTLVLRADLSGDPSASQFLARMREVCLDAYAHQDLPFERLVEEMRPERDLGRNPLYQVMFALQNTPQRPLELPGITLTQVDVENGATQVDLTLQVQETSEGLSALFEYATDLFDESTIARMATHWRSLLEAMIESPQRRVEELPLLTGAERQLVLEGWNNTQTTYPAEAASIHELFAAQVRRAPNAVAVASGGAALSYGQLDRRANQLAHALRRRGVGPEVLVGLCVNRSPDMIVALLGILKAGGAYVPLDPDYPAGRLAFMLGDCGAKVLVTQESLRASMPQLGAGCEVIYVGSDASALTAEREDPPHPALAPANLAYAIYTSGSTGQPKAALLDHRALLNLVMSEIRLYGIGARSRVLQFSSLSFDTSLSEIAMTLCSGATLYVDERNVILPGPDLERYLEREKITVLSLTPSALAVLDPKAGPSLEQIIVGGEPCPAELAARWAGRCRFFNTYGPTETTITATYVEYRDGASPPLIGRPLPNVRVYLLDKALQPVPVGVPGEIYISGVGVARGYLNRPELSAQRFLQDPFREESGSLMYRSGDFARWRSDGQIEFIGRIDDQVKIRGFRIELGEIESALNQHSGVKESVVVAGEDASGDKRLVAYVIPASPHPALVGELRSFLKERVPAYMVPAAFVLLDAFPLTPNGKLDRKGLSSPRAERQVEQTVIAPRSELEQRIAKVWREMLHLEEVGVEDNFFELGGHSLLLVKVCGKLCAELNCKLKVMDLLTYPTIEALAKYLRDETRTGTLAKDAHAHVNRRHSGSKQAEPIAIISMAGRFPGARDIEAFWANLRAGKESISFFTIDEMRESGVPETLLGDPNYVAASGYLENADKFDAGFFGYSAREAEIIDPQQRLLLECAAEVLERAGYDPDRYDGLIGIYAGASENTYLSRGGARHNGLAVVDEFSIALANAQDFLTTRISYKLNLRGPSLNVQTACSTSLVAVHQACRALWDHECDMALAGGVSVTVPLKSGYIYVQEGISSPDGHCRAFDAGAKGTVRGSGVALVLLKRLSDALKDGDRIHAVIRGTAINNDGSSKVGYTAPSVEGQTRAIVLAQASAQCDPDTIGYVETHGTGTLLGDPIEVAALTRAFGDGRRRSSPCWIGALKTNVGHLDAAAGVAGLIKTALSLEHKELVPSLNFSNPNPQIDFAASRFRVNAELQQWESREGAPRRAGVSSFGFGGTNAHAVLEEAPALEASGPSREWQLLCLSAKTETALAQATANLARHLSEHPESNLADAAYTLQIGRREFPHRRVVVCRNIADAVSTLEGRTPERMIAGLHKGGSRSVAFMFTGQGAQYPNMGLGLYRTEAVFRETVDRCCERLKSRFGLDLREVLFPAESALGEASERIKQTELTQPALFLIEYALAKLWMSLGIQPAAMIGHSVGEYVAACLAGVMSLDDALDLVAERGRMMGQLAPGSMLAVPLGEAEVLPLLSGQLSLASINSPSLCVVSGPATDIAALEARLVEMQLAPRRLHTSHAFHSSMMDPILEQFTRRVSQIPLHTPRLPYISNVTGQWITAEQATDPAYYATHLRQAVQFAKGLEQLFADPNCVLLEVGPGHTLTALARRHPARKAEHACIVSMRHPDEAQADEAVLMESAGRLWLAGVRADWRALHGKHRRRRVRLPTYPFEQKRFWLEPSKASPRKASGGRERIGRAANPTDWTYVPSWRRAPSPAAGFNKRNSNWLVFTDEHGLGMELETDLATGGARVVSVAVGERFAMTGPGKYVLNPGAREDYERLLAELKAASFTPQFIAHLWSVCRDEELRQDEDFSTECKDRGFFSLIFLAQALEACEIDSPIGLAVLTSHVHEVDGSERLCPEKALALGLCKVISMEQPHILTRSIDVAMGGDLRWLARALSSDLCAPWTESVVAYRGRYRWVQAYEQIRLEAPAALPMTLRDEGVYLITGGLGNIGLELAEYLARTVRARVVLVGRTPLPAKKQWAQWLAAHDESHPTSHKIRRVQAMEAAGAAVLVCQADVADERQMRAVIADAEARFGPLRGVMHAAGAAGHYVPIRSLKRSDCEDQFRPKLQGLRTLEKVLHDRCLDFCVVHSSLAAVMGVLDFASYAAAHLFMDAFVHRHNREAGTSWRAINWDNWEFDIPCADSRTPADTAFSKTAFYMRPAEAIDVLSRFLSMTDAAQVLVSTGDLQGRIDQVIPRERPPEDEAAAAVDATQASQAHARPALSSAYEAPRNDTERLLADMWGKTLGFNQVGIHDNFFELGGDSVISVKLILEMRKATGFDIPLGWIFRSPTVAAMVEALDAMQWLRKPSAPKADAGVREEIDL